jgi:hypothetical protein
VFFGSLSFAFLCVAVLNVTLKPTGQFPLSPKKGTGLLKAVFMVPPPSSSVMLELSKFRGPLGLGAVQIF